jgi:ATP synthase proteolipid subunit
LIVKSLVPVVMAGIVAIYGLVMSVLINTKLQSASLSDYDVYQ